MADQASIKSNTGNAQIIRQGHTTDGKFGSSPDRKVKGASSTRDLKLNIK